MSWDSTHVPTTLFMTNRRGGRERRLEGGAGLGDGATAGAKELSGWCGGELEGGSEGAGTGSVPSSSKVDIGVGRGNLGSISGKGAERW